MSRIVVSVCLLQTAHLYLTHTQNALSLRTLASAGLTALTSARHMSDVQIRRFASPPSPHTVSRSVHTKSRSAHAHTHTLTRSLHAPLLPSTQQTNPENALGRLPRPESRRQTPSAHQSSHPCSTRHTPRHTTQHTPEHTHQNTACRLPRTTSIQHAAP